VTFSWVLAFDVPKFFLSLSNFTQYSTLFIVYGLVNFFTLLLLLCIDYLEKRTAFFRLLKKSQKKRKVESLLIFFLFSFLLGIRQVFFLDDLLANTWIIFLLFFPYFILRIFYVSFLEQKQLIQILSHALEIEREENTQIKQIKHDYKDLLISLQLSLKNQDYYQAEHDLLELKGYSEKNFYPSNFQTKLNRIHLPQLRYFLQEKLASFDPEKIEIRLIIEQDITMININILDYLRCLSILLNNAYEELQNGDCSEKKYLCLKLRTKNNNLEFLIENSIHSKSKITKIFEKGTSTKEKHEGLGLYTFEKICNQYHNVNFTIETTINSFSISFNVPTS
jgi:two-component system sensor histidine kinase AgrC